MSVSLIALTDAHSVRNRVSLPRKPSFYPSEASAIWFDSHGIRRVSGGCLRNAWLRITKAAKDVALPPSPSSEWIFKLGIAVETALIDWWKEMGLWVADHVEFYDPKRNISGEMDCLIREPKTGELVICECFTPESLVVVTGNPVCLKPVTVRCPFCAQLNRIDLGRLADGPKCGGCGRPLHLDRPLKATEADFDQTIGTASVPVLVDFYADWCGPCRMMAPVLDDLARDVNHGNRCSST